jgi:DNA-binding transcriptional MerR regulator
MVHVKVTSGSSIGELADATSTPISTIRFYERKGLLPPPPRESGQRRYPPEAADRVRLIRMWQRAGFTLGEITQLLTDREDAEGWKGLLHFKIAELDQLEIEVERSRRQLRHALLCRAPDWTTCPTMQAMARETAAEAGR